MYFAPFRVPTRSPSVVPEGSEPAHLWKETACGW